MARRGLPTRLCAVIMVLAIGWAAVGAPLTRAEWAASLTGSG